MTQQNARITFFVLLSFLCTIFFLFDEYVEAGKGTTINGGVISASTTWTLQGSPYTVNGAVYVEGTSSPILTIEPGVVVKFSAGTSLTVGLNNPGALRAVGTSTSSIIFQSAKGNSQWYGLRFSSRTVSASTTIAYATISSASPGVYTYDAGLTIHHVTFSGNVHGIDVGQSATNLNLYADNFVGNGWGITTSAAVPVNASFCWWNSIYGPAVNGVGNGQPISGPITFEPWLTASASTAHYFLTPFSVKNRAFNPGIGINSTLNFTTSLAGNWTVSFLNSSNAVVRTFSGSGTAGTVTWDGKDGSGAIQPAGTYTYQLQSITPSGQTATPATGQAIIQSQLLTVDTSLSNQTYISANGDGVQDSVAISGTVSYPDATWTVNIKNSSGAIMKSISGTGGSFLTNWDGKNSSGVLQLDGIYSVEMLAVDDAASASRTAQVILDNTIPSADISSPSDGLYWSNFYQNWITDMSVVGTANDASFNYWTLEQGYGATPATWTWLVSFSSAAKINTALWTWATQALQNGTWTLRLRVYDKAGNQNLLLRTVTLGNFTVSQSAQQFNAAAGGTLNYVSKVPFSVTQTITVKDASGQVVRTLLNNVSRPSGTYTDTWNGRDDQGNILKDGGYFYVSTVSDGTITKSWDLTNQYGTADRTVYPTVTTWDPWNNKPFAFSYNFNIPGKVIIEFAAIPSAQTDPIFVDDCNVNVCLKNSEYEESGPHAVFWGMVGNNGLPRSDVNAVGVTMRQQNFSKNAVVLFGTKPVINNLKLTPPVYYPASAQQLISFDLSTYQNLPANVTVAILNHFSASVIRTINRSGVTPGPVSIPWDGKADSGFWVAPGGYTVTVSVDDSLGHHIVQRALTTIRF